MFKNKKQLKFELGFLLDLYEKAYIRNYGEQEIKYNDYEKYYDIFVDKWCYDDCISEFPDNCKEENESKETESPKNAL